MGKLGGTLRVVGTDLNLLDGSALHLTSGELHEERRLKEDMHAIVTLYRRVEAVKGKLKEEVRSIYIYIYILYVYM